MYDVSIKQIKFNRFVSVKNMSRVGKIENLTPAWRKNSIVSILFSRLSVEICFLELHCYHFKRNSKTILRENRNKIVEYFDSDSLLHLFILINFPAVFLDISNIYCYRKL